MNLKVGGAYFALCALMASAAATANASTDAGGSGAAPAARIDLPRAKFATGDDPARASPAFDDSAWQDLSTLSNYEKQGFDGYDGWSWYRIHVTIPASLKNTVHWQQRLRIYLSSVDDVDETFLNGVKIGQTGRLPGDPQGYDTSWQALREYYVDLTAGLVKWDQDNVIAVRVYDGSGGGGFYRDMPYLNMAEIVDGLRLDTSGTRFRYAPGQVTIQALFANSFPAALNGTLTYEIYDAAADRVLSKRSQALTFDPDAAKPIEVIAPQRAGIEVRYRYTEASSGAAMTATQVVPYLMTPSESPKPRINGARVVGARSGSPFLFRVAATGRASLSYSATNLPAGLMLDTHTGLITGTVATAGDYTVPLRVSNALGSGERDLIIRIGDTLALTPPMGWNSWNAYGLDVNDARVRATADAFLSTGLAAHGWTYVNIDDGWEAKQRASNGEIRTNAKFPDMNALSNYLHERGFRIGIYSSPGPLTCGRFLGSLDHEEQDAASYARWGIDYLKYDLCSYEDRMSKEKTRAEHQAPYRLMGEALRVQARDIVFSMCQYGNREVWKWGAEVRGNSWRTTGDIEDTWASTATIGFAQDTSAAYAQPGHWNDPDMLVVGNVGWGGALHPSRLTPDEQYSHISLWSLLAAPLLLGNDLTTLDDFTRNLLSNDEVIAIDQDPLGHAARQVLVSDNWQVWVRELSDGRHAVGVFNLGAQFRMLKLRPQILGLSSGARVRDLWRQKDLGALRTGFEVRVPAHGVLLLAVGTSI